MILAGYPGFLPGLVAALVVSLVAGRSLAAALSIPRALAVALLLAAGAIVAATLFPDVLGLEVPPPPTAAGWTCDVSRFAPSLGELLELEESTANVVLFVPLGVVVALLPPRLGRIAIPLAVASPFAIELIQMVVPSLHRACQTADIADNLTGLVAGLVVGFVVGLLLRRREHPPIGG